MDSHADTLFNGPQPIGRNEWITWPTENGETIVARAIEPQDRPNDPFHVRIFCLDQMNRLTETGRYTLYRPGNSPPPPPRATVWLESPPPPRPRADGLDPADLRQTILARRPQPKPTYRYAGPSSNGAVDLTHWLMMGLHTLHEPKATPLVQVRNHNIYAALVSRLFMTDNATPSAFSVGGSWHGLLTRGHELEETKAIFSGARTQALPMSAAQALYHWHVDTLAVTSHLPGENDCPLCLAQGHRVHNPSRHRIDGCAFSAILIRCILTAWRERFPSETWTDPLTDPLAFSEIVPGHGLPRDRTLRRAFALGLRPVGQRDAPQVFALLRGLTIQAINEASRSTWHAQQDGLDPISSDLYHAWTVPISPSPPLCNMQ